MTDGIAAIVQRVLGIIGHRADRSDEHESNQPDPEGIFDHRCTTSSGHATLRLSAPRSAWPAWPEPPEKRRLDHGHYFTSLIRARPMGSGKGGFEEASQTVAGNAPHGRRRPDTRSTLSVPGPLPHFIPLPG